MVVHIAEPHLVGGHYYCSSSVLIDLIKTCRKEGEGCSLLLNFGLVYISIDLFGKYRSILLLDHSLAEEIIYVNCILALMVNFSNCATAVLFTLSTWHGF